MQQRRVQRRPADIVEIEIDAVGAGTADRRGQIVLRLVVDDRIEAQFVGEPGAFLRSAGDADHTAGLDAGDLCGDLPHAAGGGRDQHALARLHRADIAHPEIGGHRAEAERTDPGQRIAARYDRPSADISPATVGWVCQPSRACTNSPG